MKTYILSRQETHFSLLDKNCSNLVSMKPPKISSILVISAKTAILVATRITKEKCISRRICQRISISRREK